MHTGIQTPWFSLDVKIPVPYIHFILKPVLSARAMWDRILAFQEADVNEEILTRSGEDQCAPFKTLKR
jgi:hypothetical protein